jgi:hypothetical protein
MRDDEILSRKINLRRIDKLANVVAPFVGIHAPDPLRAMNFAFVDRDFVILEAWC